MIYKKEGRLYKIKKEEEDMKKTKSFLDMKFFRHEVFRHEVFRHEVFRHEVLIKFLLLKTR